MVMKTVAIKRFTPDVLAIGHYPHWWAGTTVGVRTVVPALMALLNDVSNFTPEKQ
jgi:hypothetical protein